MSNTTAERYLSKTQFADLKGWHRSYVTKLGTQGRLVLSPDGKKVDVPATIARLEGSSDPGKEHVTQRHAEQRVERHVGQFTKPDAPSDDVPTGGNSDPKFWASKGRRESALADMAELELQVKLGKLVDRAAIESAIESLHRMLRDSLMGLPTRLAPEFSAMTDAFAIEQKFRDAMRKLLDDLSKLTAQELQGSDGSTH